MNDVSAKINIATTEPEKVKSCFTCSENKPVTRFPLTGAINKNGEAGRKRTCKECEAKQRAWKWRNLPEYKEVQLKRAKKRYDTDLVWRDAQKSRIARNQKIRTHRVRAERYGLKESFTLEEWENLKDAYKGCCAACGCSGRMTIDHVIPLCKGGVNTIDNIQPLCASCNSGKHTRSIDYRAKKSVP